MQPIACQRAEVPPHGCGGQLRNFFVVSGKTRRVRLRAPLAAAVWGILLIGGVRMMIYSTIGGCACATSPAPTPRPATWPRNSGSPWRPAGGVDHCNSRGLIRAPRLAMIDPSIGLQHDRRRPTRSNHCNVRAPPGAFLNAVIGVSGARPGGSSIAAVDRARVVAEVGAWYAGHARDLPWRRPGTTPWGVMVSEFMLQQTPVARVEPVWLAWLERWPTPGSLAAEASGEAVRAWGRLGYPRRAQRLHAAASEIVARFDGRVPSTVVELRTLPGVGEYTAAAIASFAFGRREVVLDTNVRRVLARLDDAVAYPTASVTRGERERAAAWVPGDAGAAALWAVSSMELGAQVCTAIERPDCGRCPVPGDCRWRAAGYPAWEGPDRRAQSYAGTDRQCRGALLAVLREASGPVPRARVLAAWTIDAQQAERALASLLEDVLVRLDCTGDLTL